jgi:hypothetical protein
MQAACQNQLAELLHYITLERLGGMTKTDLTLQRGRLLALRTTLQGDMTTMEDNALNKDHAKTTSMPNHMAELASGNFDQEFTLSLLGNEKNAWGLKTLTQRKMKPRNELRRKISRSVVTVF